MAFIQIIDVRTSKVDEMRKLDREYEAAVGERSTVQRSIVVQDRNDPDHVMVLVFFDSYESAMENSNLPETGEFAARWAELADQPPAFLDLDVIEDRTMG